jgi:hypothetical protein
MAQGPYYQLTGIETTIGPLQLSFAFSGGLNTPQFSTINDLNGDGAEDLVLFDRSGDKFQTFLNVSTDGADSFIHAPQYESGFPRVRNWALLRDLDCDGLRDLIASNETRIAWYRATGPGSFVKVTDTLHYVQSSFTKDFYVNLIDIPGFFDINGDGDLDVLTFAPSGGFIEYFENQSIEEFGDCAHPSFAYADRCWGDVYESGFTKRVELDTCGPPFTGHLPDGSRHTGSTVCVFDADGNGTAEALLGDLNFTNLNLLINGGTPDDAHVIAQDTAFPSYTVEANLPQFPAAFFLDANLDSVRDLLVSPNAKHASADVQNTWLYRNVGRDDSVEFEFVSNDFFAKHTIDVGRNSAPVFFDHNADGLLDIVIGNYSRTGLGGTSSASLALYANTGTQELPAFTLISGNYANVTAPGLFGLAPTFGDLDDDGDEDMILGNETGELHRFTNTAGAGNPAQFTLTHPVMHGIDVGSFSTPQLIDADRDGDLDLIVGERNGNLNYFWNMGSTALPVFNKDSVNAFWGSVDVTLLGSLVGYSFPFLYDDTTTNGYALLVGSDHGYLYRYTHIEGNLGGAFTEVDTMYYGIDPGERSTVSGGYLNGDGALELLVGNFRGGVEIFTRSFITGAGPRPALASYMIYPNPAQAWVSVEGDTPITGITIVDLAGDVVMESGVSRVDITPLPDGLYFLAIRSRNELVTRPLVVLRP